MSQSLKKNLANIPNILYLLGWKESIDNQLKNLAGNLTSYLTSSVNSIAMKNLSWNPRTFLTLGAYCHQIDVKAITYLRRKKREILSSRIVGPWGLHVDRCGLRGLRQRYWNLAGSSLFLKKTRKNRTFKVNFLR